MFQKILVYSGLLKLFSILHRELGRVINNEAYKIRVERKRLGKLQHERGDLSEQIVRKKFESLGCQVEPTPTGHPHYDFLVLFPDNKWKKIQVKTIGNIRRSGNRTGKKRYLIKINNTYSIKNFDYLCGVFKDSNRVICMPRNKISSGTVWLSEQKINKYLLNSVNSFNEK